MFNWIKSILVEVLETFLKYLKSSNIPPELTTSSPPSTVENPPFKDPTPPPVISPEIPPGVDVPVVSRGGLSLEFDDIFSTYGRGIPIEYLRALSYSEGRMNPDYELEKGIDVGLKSYPDGRKDTYWGLFQIGISNVLKDYNSRYKTTLTTGDLFDPVVNTKLAVDTLVRIVDSYRGWTEKYSIKNMETDWSNLEFVRLVTAGWNSGYSRSAGVQRVAEWLSEKKIEVTHDNVFKYANQVPKATKFLDGKEYGKKREWQKKVAERYFRERGVDII